MTKDEFIKKLITIFEPKLSYKNLELYYKNEIKISIPDDFEINTETNFLLQNSIGVYHKNELEILIKSLDGRCFDNNTKNANYEIQISEIISDQLCFNLINELPNERIRMFLPFFRLERIVEEKNHITIFDLIRTIFVGYYSLKVKTLTESSDHVELLQLAKSYIFNISMLQNKNFYIIESIQDFLYDLRPNVRRIAKNNIDIPYKKYIDDVVQYYVDGNSARVPKIKFLSFYNVLEYFFDKIYIDDKCKKIQDIITNPKFNHNNLIHYKKILEILDIKKAKNLGKVNITELDSLKLLISKYINLNEFREFLNENKYYIENDAHKISDTKLNISDSDDCLVSKTAKRVYQVRNALVHSKDTENIKYIPRKDDVYIYNEIVLIKYLAQEIIISTSDLIK